MDRDPNPESRIHNPKSGGLLLYWDYDTQRGAEQSRLGVQRWGPLERPNTARILELLTEFGVRATFACVGYAAVSRDPAYDCRDQIREIHAAGHEVASHSHEHEFLPKLSPAQARETARVSREALEELIGAPVVSFVPPFNRPMHYPRRGAVSWSERWEVGPAHLSLPALCEALRETGYRTCRVAYRPNWRTAWDRVVGRQDDRPVVPEKIAGLTCFRLNTPGGFDGPAVARVRQAAERGGLAVVFGHPHSLTAENNQAERWLRPFLEEVAALRRQGRLIDCLPRELAASVPSNRRINRDGQDQQDSGEGKTNLSDPVYPVHPCEIAVKPGAKRP
jgi:peptidoglycan/xylan/chitin deacetylase (PgdA/CDA1 family)